MSLEASNLMTLYLSLKKLQIKTLKKKSPDIRVVSYLGYLSLAAQSWRKSYGRVFCKVQEISHVHELFSKTASINKSKVKSLHSILKMWQNFNTVNKKSKVFPHY